MSEREGLFHSIAHIPGDYAKGMESVFNDKWFVNAAVLHSFVGFLGGGILGLIGSFGAMALEKTNSGFVNPDTPGIGWWVGVALINTLITTLAVVDGKNSRRKSF